jgi:uncharacterized protein (TIGR03437 family)
MLRHAALALLLIGVISPHLRGETGQSIRILAVVSANDFSNSWPVPGGLGTVFCTGLEGVAGTVIAEGFPVPNSLNGVRVQFGGVAESPVLAVTNLGSYQQINFQVPWEATGGSGIAVWQDKVRSDFAHPPDSNLWSVFFTHPGTALAVAQHAADYSLVTAENPAEPGEWVLVYASNLGPVSPLPPNGMPPEAGRLAAITDPSVRVMFAGFSDSPAQVLFIGLTPGTVGVYQINVRIPAGARGSGLALSLSRQRFCGFFFVPGCGRGWVTEHSRSALIPAGSK